MKQKDLALIGVVVFISIIASLFISKAIFASPKSRKQEVEQVQVITAEFSKPDKHYFNEQSIDPTKLIQIGENANPDPFSGGPSTQ